MGQRKNPLLTLVINKKLLKEIDEFRFDNRFQSRAEAIRWLLEWALNQGATPPKNDSIQH